MLNQLEADASIPSMSEWTKQAMVFSRLRELDIFPIDGIFSTYSGLLDYKFIIRGRASMLSFKSLMEKSRVKLHLESCLLSTKAILRIKLAGSAELSPQLTFTKPGSDLKILKVLLVSFCFRSGRMFSSPGE